MADTFFSLHVHCVFSTKNREPLVGETRERLWAFMGGIAKRNGVKPICIGGVEDHVHLLLSLPTTLSVAKTVQLIKGGSSTLIYDTLRTLRNFAWQTGYGAFAVSTSHVPGTFKIRRNIIERKAFRRNASGSSKNMGLASKNGSFGINCMRSSRGYLQWSPAGMDLLPVRFPARGITGSFAAQVCAPNLSLDRSKRKIWPA